MGYNTNRYFAIYDTLHILRNGGGGMTEIERNGYLQQLIDRKENGMIKIITGIRRAGKSYLLFNIFYRYLLREGVPPENVICIDLDDDKKRDLRDPDRLYDYLLSKIADEREQYYILLDEVQFAISTKEIESSEPIRLYGVLNGLSRRRNVDIYVTGSNSRFLSSDIRTEFRGRGDTIHVYPLSFSEYYRAKGGDKSDAWREYFNYGGLPYILSCKSTQQKAQYLSDILENVYLRDVIERNHLRGNNAIDKVLDIIASSVGSLTNPKKLANAFQSNGIKISDATIRTYLDCLEDAFLIKKTERYDIKGKKYIDSPYKYYFADVGLRNSRLNFRQQEENHIMENIIFNELLVRGFNVDVGIVPIRTRSADGKQASLKTEVDFVCNQGNRRYYIQSAFSIPDREKLEQEQRSLTHINDSFKKIIVVKDNIEPWRNDNGILIVGIYDFLLNPHSLDL